MKKVTLIFAGTLLTVITFAQQPVATERKEGMKDLRKDIRKERQEKRERNADLREGKFGAARQETKEIRAEKRDIKEDAKELKEEGVKHPIKRADRQIHRQNMAK